jgi:hypothetical protein
MIGETNSSNKSTLTPDKPLGAVFAAGDALSWLAQGASTVDWWQQADAQNSGGDRTNATYSMFDGDGNPQTPFWGWLLASKLARPGAQLSADAANTSSTVLAFISTLANGHQAEAYINLSTTSNETVSSPFSSGPVREWQYSNQNPTIIEQALQAPQSVTVPPESVTVIEQ